jgi:hypothetical protein
MATIPRVSSDTLERVEATKKYIDGHYKSLAEEMAERRKKYVKVVLFHFR